MYHHRAHMAVVYCPTQYHPSDPGTVGKSGGAEQRIDRRPVAVLTGPASPADGTVFEKDM